MQYAVIDESGRFADPESKILVFAAVTADSLVGLDKIVARAKKKIPVKGKRKAERLVEIKFSQTGNRTRETVLRAINKQKLEIFLLVVDTEGRKVADNPENYAFLVSTLLGVIKRKNPGLKHVIIDRHFTWIYQREKFNELVQKYLRKRLFIEHLDSQQNTIVALPDFVAGGIREYHTKGAKEWRELVESKITYEKKVSWRDLRQQKKVKA